MHQLICDNILLMLAMNCSNFSRSLLSRWLCWPPYTQHSLIEKSKGVGWKISAYQQLQEKKMFEVLWNIHQLVKRTENFRMHIHLKIYQCTASISLIWSHTDLVKSFHGTNTFDFDEIKASGGTFFLFLHFLCELLGHWGTF